MMTPEQSNEKRLLNTLIHMHIRTNNQRNNQTTESEQSLEEELNAIYQQLINSYWPRGLLRNK